MLRGSGQDDEVDVSLLTTDRGFERAVCKYAELNSLQVTKQFLDMISSSSLEPQLFLYSLFTGCIISVSKSKNGGYTKDGYFLCKGLSRGEIFN